MYEYILSNLHQILKNERLSPLRKVKFCHEYTNKKNQLSDYRVHTNGEMSQIYENYVFGVDSRFNIIQQKLNLPCNQIYQEQIYRLSNLWQVLHANQDILYF